MKNKRLIFIGVGLVGAYLLYKKYGKKQNKTKKQAHDYKDAESCLEAGYGWGGRGIVASCYNKGTWIK
jgi:hypothetical protein